MPKITNFKPYAGRGGRGQAGGQAPDAPNLVQIFAAKERLVGFQHAQKQEQASRQALGMRMKAMMETQRGVGEIPEMLRQPGADAAFAKDTPYVQDPAAMAALLLDASPDVIQWVMEDMQVEAEMDAMDQGKAALVNRLDQQMAGPDNFVEKRPELEEIMGAWREAAMNAQSPQELEQLEQQLNSVLGEERQRQFRQDVIERRMADISSVEAELQAGDQRGANLAILRSIARTQELDSKDWEMLTIAAEHPGVLPAMDFALNLMKASGGVVLFEDALKAYDKAMAERAPQPPPPPGQRTTLAPEEITARVVETAQGGGDVMALGQELGIPLDEWMEILEGVAGENTPKPEQGPKLGERPKWQRTPAKRGSAGTDAMVGDWSTRVPPKPSGAARFPSDKITAMTTRPMTELSPSIEPEFREWLRKQAKTLMGLGRPAPDPDDESYDYRGAYLDGRGPDEKGNWPPEYHADAGKRVEKGEPWRPRPRLKFNNPNMPSPQKRP